MKGLTFGIAAVALECSGGWVVGIEKKKTTTVLHFIWHCLYKADLSLP